MSAIPVIIIADPDPMVSNALRVEFSRHDCAVLMASSGQEVEEYAAQTVAQMIVLDVTARKLNGYGACARIRHRRGYANRPIVLTVDRALPRDQRAARRAGATLLLPKPYSVAGLVRAVTPYLSSDDPLREHLPPVGDAGQVEWQQDRSLAWQFGTESGLSRNGRMLPILRGKGVRIPLIKAT